MQNDLLNHNLIIYFENTDDNQVKTAMSFLKFYRLDSTHKFSIMNQQSCFFMEGTVEDNIANSMRDYKYKSKNKINAVYALIDKKQNIYLKKILEYIQCTTRPVKKLTKLELIATRALCSLLIDSKYIIVEDFKQRQTLDGFKELEQLIQSALNFEVQTNKKTLLVFSNQFRKWQPFLTHKASKSDLGFEIEKIGQIKNKNHRSVNTQNLIYNQSEKYSA